MEMSYEPLSIDLRQPSSAALQAAIQAALAERGWSDPSDSVMAEYVLVMLANAKRKEQIDAELTELIGSEYNPEFTHWLWTQAAGSSAPEQGSIEVAATSSAPDSARSTLADSTESLRQGEAGERQARARDSRSPPSERVRYRRSQSPPRRRPSRSPPPRGFGRADHWEPRRRGSLEAEERWPRAARHRQEREPRELFASALSSASRQGFRASSSSSSETMSPIEEEPQEQAFRVSSAATDTDDAPTIPTGPRNMRIRGQARGQAHIGGGPSAPRELFMRSAAGANASNGAARPPKGPRAEMGSGLSLLARAGVPDPRAPAFVPSAASPPQGAVAAPSAFSLAARLDPMVPSNPTAPPSEAAQPVAQSFPTQPSKSSLCRYASSCTNPTCEYSHPSPASAIAKKRGEIKEDPILTSEQSCKFGVRCTKVDCPFSHVSPAVFFVGQKGLDSAPPPMPAGDTTQIPCRFAEECSNPSCAYAHFDANGNLAPSPALARLVNPNFKAAEQNGDPGGDGAESDGDGDVDFDMGGGDSGGNGEGSGGAAATSTQLGPDGKPAALDRALGDGSAPSGGPRPCKFGSGCTRADCWFSHPAGRRIDGNDNGASSVSGKNHSNGAATSTVAPKLHVSDRLSRFNREGEMDATEGEMERIIPAS